jgi:hypothetical protein
LFLGGFLLPAPPPSVPPPRERYMGRETQPGGG